MCGAVPLAAVLLGIVFGLTLLRLRAPASPNADMLSDLIASTEAEPCRKSREDACHKGSGTPAHALR